MTYPVIRGISHIAIAVKSFADIKKWLTLFPVEKTTKYSSEEQRVNALVVHLEGFDIEFLEPTTETSSISSFLEKNPKGGLHHVCFYVDSLESSLSRIKQEGIRSITLRKALGVIHKSPVAFLNPKDLSGVLIEFEELTKN